MAKLKETPKPGSDVYTGLLGLSLGAMVIGCVLLGLDLQSYGERQPPTVPALTVPKPVGQQASPGQPRTEEKTEPAPTTPEKKDGTFRLPEPTMPTPVLTAAPAALPVLPELSRVDPKVVPAVALQPIPILAPAPKAAGSDGPPLGITPFQIPK